MNLGVSEFVQVFPGGPSDPRVGDGPAGNLMTLCLHVRREKAGGRTEDERRRGLLVQGYDTEVEGIGLYVEYRIVVFAN